MRRLEAVIFDWAGTTIDFGSLAPVRALTKLFASRGIPISDADARRDMGLYKKDHIRRVLKLPHVENEWKRLNEHDVNEEDVEGMFADFAAIQMQVLEEHALLIEGVLGVTQKLRDRGLRLGSTTGYPRSMLDVLVARAEEQGYRAELNLCPDDVCGGRPHPWMCLRIALEFHLSSTAAAVKVGDTASDVEEGLNAGMWTVGVAATGNEIGLNASQLAGLATEEYQRRLNQARGNLLRAGAHYVIANVAALEPTLDQIDRRLASGERP